MAEETGSEGVAEGTATEIPATESAAAVPAAAAEDKSGGGREASVSATPPAGGEGTPLTAYTPNFKYKVSGQEKEVPEWARAAAKDASTEKQLKELFEKADGLEPVKLSRQKLEEQVKVWNEQYAPFIQNAQNALGFANKGDLDTFFEIVGIPEVAILKYALHRLKLRDKPEAAAAYEQQRQVQLENARLHQQVEGYRQQSVASAVSARSNELQTKLAQPEIAAAVSQFDQQHGNGSFWQKCVERGNLYHVAQKIDMSVDQVVNEVMRLYVGPVSLPNPAAVMPGIASPQAAPKATLPNIRGTGGSPTKKLPRSTDELRQLGRAMQSAALGQR